MEGKSGIIRGGLKNLDHLDKCYSILDLKCYEGEQEMDYEGEKFPGPQRVKLLCTVPENEKRFVFVYYFEVFGALDLS